MKFEGYKTGEHPELNAVVDLLVNEHSKPRRKRSQFVYAMRNVIINLWQADQVDEPLEIGLWKKRYKPHRWFSHSHVTSIVNFLIANEYVTKKRGYQAHEKNGERVGASLTKLYVEPRLRALFERMYNLEVGYDYALAPYIFLKDASGDFLKPPITVKRHQMEARARSINEALRLHIYTLPSPPTTHLGSAPLIDKELRFCFFLRRIFSRGRTALTHGGRFYSRSLNAAPHPQGMPKDLRQTIRIDAQPTVELDFGGLHIRMLYALNSIQFDEDPYAKIDAPRGDAKLMLLMAINAKDRLSALRAFRLETKRWEPELYDAIVAAHAPIGKCIGSDWGIRLQRLDSEIAERVLMHFTSRHKACIPIHDSFIVKEEDADELEVEYSNVMHGFTCPIK